MLRNLKESEFSNLNNTNESNNSLVANEEYLNTIEFRNIKQLLCEEHLEYVTEYLRRFRKVRGEC